MSAKSDNATVELARFRVDGHGLAALVLDDFPHPGVSIDATGSKAEKGIVAAFLVTVSPVPGVTYRFERLRADILEGAQGLCSGEHGLDFGGARYESRGEAPSLVRQLAELAFARLRERLLARMGRTS